MITAQGIGSGLDVASIVGQLVAAEGQPATLRLARREASIQSELSGLGAFKSALSSFRDALSDLKNVDTFRSRTATSGNEDLFTATATTGAVPSEYEVEVLSVASAHKLATQAFSDANEKQFGAGTLILKTGDAQDDAFAVVIDEEASTLNDIRDAINSNTDNPNIRASIVNADDGVRLVLNSVVTGEDNQIEIEVQDGDYGFLSYGPSASGSTMTELRAAANARIRVDTFESESASNSFSNVADGVSINVAGAEPGTLTSLTIAYDTGAATAKAEEFVSAYNSMLDALASLTRFDAETGDRGALLGDSGVRDVVGSLRREMAGGGLLDDGTYRSLTRAGITTELDGKLNIDASALSEALNDDFDAFARLFGSEDGFATRVDAVLDPYLETGGRLDERTEGLEKSIELIEEQRTQLQFRLESVEARLLAEFTALDTIVTGLTATSDFLSAQLASVPTAG
ncbi:MAG: flagellar filament capping protein FliD [Pseudomonadota bacterium]